MTVSQQTPPTTTDVSSPIPPKRRNGRWSGFAHLLMARMKELKREPEVIFWVFIFPLLLALGLGIAFRNKPADVARIAIVAGPGAHPCGNVCELLGHDGKRRILHAPIGAVGIAREFRIRQPRAEIRELIGANRKRRQKTMSAGSADDVVLIHTVAADPDRADENAVSIKWKAAWKTGDAVRQIKPDPGS